MNWGSFFIALGVLGGFVNVLSIIDSSTMNGESRPRIHWTLCGAWTVSLAIGIGLLSS